MVTSFPRKAARKEKRQETALVCCCVAADSNGSKRWLLRKRPADAGLLAGLLEFPTFDLKEGEDGKDVNDDDYFKKKT